MQIIFTFFLLEGLLTDKSVYLLTINKLEGGSYTIALILQALHIGLLNLVIGLF